MRVVSLVPSVTETLVAWGVTPVACTRFCEQPSIRAVGGTKNPDLGAIAALEPDLVVMDQEENRRPDYEALRAAGVPVLALAVRSLRDVDHQMAMLAARVGARWEGLGGGSEAGSGARSAPGSPRTGPGAEAPEVPEAALKALEVPETALRPDQGAAGLEGSGPSVFVPIWRRPFMALGAPTYGTSLLGSLGITNVFAAAPEPYPKVTLAEAAARRPAAVLAPSEPYPFSERHRAELETVAPVAFVDGKDLFWWGERTRSARGRLAGALAGLVGDDGPRATGLPERSHGRGSKRSAP